MADSVEEKIIEDIEARLAEVTVANGFTTDVKLVRRQHGNAMDLNRFPAAIIVHEGTTRRNDRLGMVVCTLTLSLILAMRSDGVRWPDDLQAFIADVDNKLRADVTRGGNAIITAIPRAEVYDSEELGSADIVAAQSIVEVEYRHLYLDTSTPI